MVSHIKLYTILMGISKQPESQDTREQPHGLRGLETFSHCSDALSSDLWTVIIRQSFVEIFLDKANLPGVHQ